MRKSKTQESNSVKLPDKLPKDISRNLSREERKEVYKKVKAGELKDHKQAKSYTNLIPLNERTPEERSEISRKGAEALKAIRGEKKTAKEILDTFLSLYANVEANAETMPDDMYAMLSKHKDIKVTQYDVLMLSMLKEAQNGNVKAATFIRDTVGDSPKDIQEDRKEAIPEAYQALMKKLQARLNIQAEQAEVIDADYKEIKPE